MELLILEIICNNDLSKPSIFSSKSSLDVTLDYFKDKINSFSNIFKKDVTCEKYLVHSDNLFIHKLHGKISRYTTILEYDDNFTQSKKNIIRDWFEDGNKVQSFPMLLLVASLSEIKEMELYEKLLSSKNKLLGNIYTSIFKNNAYVTSSAYFLNDGYQGNVKGLKDYNFDLSNLKLKDVKYLHDQFDLNSKTGTLLSKKIDEIMSFLKK